MATLTSTFTIPELRLNVLQTWRRLFSALQLSELTLYLVQTLATVSSAWSKLDDPAQQEALALVHDLALQGDSAKKALSRANVCTEMVAASSSLSKLKAKARLPTDVWAGILQDLQSDSQAVIVQTLGALRSFLQGHRDLLAELATGSKFDPLVGKTVSTLVMISSRTEMAVSGEMAQLVFECLGCVGAVDPDRIDAPQEEPIRIMLTNFKDSEEAIDFAIHLIRDVLVNAFRVTDNTRHQANLAYAIQELLKFCGFTPALLESNVQASRGTAPPVKTRLRWQNLPPHMLDTVAPLLESRYSTQFHDAAPRAQPLCRNTGSYREWLQTWTGQLIKATADTPAQPIFLVFRGVVLEHDLTVAQHILPHLVLSVIISGPEERRDEVRNEFMAILNDLDSGDGADKAQSLMLAQVSRQTMHREVCSI